MTARFVLGSMWKVVAKSSLSFDSSISRADHCKIFRAMDSAGHALGLLLIIIIARFASGFHDDLPVSSNTIYDETSARRTVAASPFRYLGGRLLVDPITVNFFWVGDWPKRAKRTLRSAFRSLNPDASVGNYPTGNYPTLSSWWSIATQYKDSNSRPVSSNISLGNECSLAASSIKLTELLETFRQAFDRAAPLQKNCTKFFRPDHNAVYHILLGKRVVVDFSGTSASLLDLAGCARRAGLFRVDESGPEISVAWARVPLHKEYCNLLTRYGTVFRPPNGRSGGMDSIVSSVLAQTADMATNWDFRGWLSTDLQTSISRRCPSPTGWEDSRSPVIRDRDLNISWNAYGIGGSRFLVQQLWNQKQQNCAIKPQRSCRGTKNLTAVSGMVKAGLVVSSTPGSKVGLQLLNRNLDCRWIVRVKRAAHIRIRLHYLALGPDDRLEVSYESRDRERKTISLRGLSYGRKLVNAAGSSFGVRLVTGARINPNSMGWMINYRAGYCDRRADVFDPEGSISDGSPKGGGYMKDTNCSWMFHARQYTKIWLNFTKLDTVPDRDLIRVYQSGNLLATYSGRNMLPREVFIGPILVVFTTETRSRGGWELDYVIYSPEASYLSYTAKSAAATVVGVICGVLVPGLCFTGAAAICCNSSFRGILRYKQKKKIRLTESKQMKFSLDEIQNATEDFSLSNVIAGSSGNVFRGSLLDGTIVAVKNGVSDSELETLLRIHSTEIVNLVGFSLDSETNCLVFDYMHLGCLSRRLFDETMPPISWGNRLRIATQIARALEYLHTYAEPFVVHLNVAADNILLDGSWNAKLGGFGRAQSGGGSIKPAMKLQDVYGFGNLLLELVTGRSSGDRKHKREALAAIEADDGLGILDKRLGNRSPSANIVVKIGEIAAWCMSDKSRQPSMVEVASSLGQVTHLFVNSASRT